MKKTDFHPLLLLLLWAPLLHAEQPPLWAAVVAGTARVESTGNRLPAEIKFSYRNRLYTAYLRIDSETYNRLTLHMLHNPRPRTLAARVAFVRDHAEAVVPLAEALRTRAPDQNAKTLAAFTLAFVQALPYQLDALTTAFDDAWRTPLQTLVDGEIDCEDSSILYTALLMNMGIDSALMVVPGHILAGVAGSFQGRFVEYQRKRYYVAETTGTGWDIGVLPPPYQRAEVEVLPIAAAAGAPPVAQVPEGGPPSPPTPPSPETTRNAGGSGGLWLLLLITIVALGAWLIYNRDIFESDKPQRNDEDDFEW